MSPSIKRKTAIPVFLVAIVLACFAILRSVQAAEPNGIQAVNIFNTPFQRDGFAIIRPGGGFDNVVFDIPAGKTLVVEFVSVFGDFPAGEQATQLSISTSGAQAFLVWNFQASPANADRDYFVASQQIRLYAKTFLSVAANRDLIAGNAYIHATVHGYLVNTP